MKYLLDSNIFIEAHQRYYHERIVPSFWQWLLEDPDIFTIEAVKAEITQAGDWLSAFMKAVKVIGDEAGAGYMADLAEHVTQRYPNSIYQQAFLQAADITLIAVAKAGGYTVVTREEKIIEQPNMQKIKIPNVCEALGVAYDNDIFTVLRRKNINLASYRTVES